MIHLTLERVVRLTALLAAFPLIFAAAWLATRERP